MLRNPLKYVAQHAEMTNKLDHRCHKSHCFILRHVYALSRYSR